MSGRAESSREKRPLSGRGAVVTGGGSGIGAAIARELCAAGATVALVGRRMQKLERHAAELERECGARVVCVAGDMTNARDVDRVFAELPDQGLPVSAILVNSVGGAETALFVDTNPSLWKRMLDSNLTSVYLCTRAVLPGMIEARRGRIINVASTAGLRGYPFVSAYVAAKHAVVGLTRALAIEVEPYGITVNALCPGYTRTEMLSEAARTVSVKTGRSVETILGEFAAANAGGKLVEPDAVAKKVLWLCLPEQGAVSGQAIPMEGKDG